MTYKKADITVIGGGHAGCEAALAAARMGFDTVLITMNLDTIAQMSCNPAIGGLAKGHLVREIDALGGEMAKVIDITGIQFRVLKRSKLPAVWAPRAQADRAAYRCEMKRRLEVQNRLTLYQGEVVSIIHEDGEVRGVGTSLGLEILSKKVIITSGTFMSGVIHVGLKNFPGGRAGEFPSVGLPKSLEDMGYEIRRFKTGTPPRVDGKTVDFSKTVRQEGDRIPQPFSFSTEKIDIEQIPCHLTGTNRKTHDILRSGLDRSPMYTGIIKGMGPRYCSSIEDKIMRFHDKESHQLFLEPEGRDTPELYVNGELFGTKGAGGGVIEAANGLRIGASGTIGEVFNGIIDDVGIFNEALSEDDIKDLYDKGLGMASGIAAVESSGKLATTWAVIKVR